MACKYLSGVLGEICGNSNSPYVLSRCPVKQHDYICKLSEIDVQNSYDLLLRHFYSDPKPGYLYAVEYDDGAVKIGYTRNASKRFYHLQKKYRGYESLIVKTCIGGKINDCRQAEHEATFGLKPIEKREIFPIEFEYAVQRIQAITPNEEMFLTCCRQETVFEFPFLATPKDKQKPPRIA